MKTSKRYSEPACWRKAGVAVCVGLASVLMALSLSGGEYHGGFRGGGRSFGMDRFSHGSLRHADTHVFERRGGFEREPGRSFGGGGGVERWGGDLRRGWGSVVVNGDRMADFGRRHFWHDFGFGLRCGALPLGYLSLQIGGVPYCYSDGIYYQPVDGGYQEVYPPVGAAVPLPPPGAMAVYADGQTYYYAGGAFYVLQPDGTYATVPPPIGVVVPELPPGAAQVFVRGAMAYQFNGVDYQPVFVNGVTQYQTIMP
jgi:hypothetical protein